MIDHAKTYVEGRVRTNGLENFWSLLKRAIRGCYVWVSPEHLHRRTLMSRRTARQLTDGERFKNVMRKVVGRRLTFSALITREAVA